jgi:putative SOS response-associated peptidase YedK
MCGRFANNKTIEQQSTHFKAEPRQAKWQRSANCAPGQQLPIVFQHKLQRFLRLAHWGFQPDWAKGKLIINAQSETAAEKSTFKQSYSQQRCLVPAVAFYEWQQHSDGKRPVIIQANDQHLFAMAGLWQLETTNENTVGRFTVLTTDACEAMQDIHKRMPVILRKENYRAWLNQETDINDVNSYCRPYASESLNIQTMDKCINSINNNDPTLLDPYLLN